MGIYFGFQVMESNQVHHCWLSAKVRNRREDSVHTHISILSDYLYPEMDTVAW